MSLTPPPNFLIFNNQNSKSLAIVVDIDGIDYLTSTAVGRPLEYGDPFNYGDPGLLYGSLVPLGTKAGERGQRQLIEPNGSTLSIQQTLEPESGRGSISTMTMNFVDKDSYMTKAVSSGPIVDEILGRQVKIWFGYAQTRFPDDYFILWRGRVGQVNAGVSKVSMQFLDPNVVRRQSIFYAAETQTIAAMLSTDTQVPVMDSSSFNMKVPGPSGGYDTTVRTFLKIDDEFIEYQQAGSESTGFGGPVFAVSSANATVGSIYEDEVSGFQFTVQATIVAGTLLSVNAGTGTPSASGVLTLISGTGDMLITYSAFGDQFINVIRGVSPTGINGNTTPEAHDVGATVDAYVMLTGNIMDLSLKIMMSGWQGPYVTGQAVNGLVTTGDPSQPTILNCITLPINTDAIRDLGISVGDFITTSGSIIGGNNVVANVIGFTDILGQSNRGILMDINYTAENPTAAVIALRSQYDVYPDSCGCQLPGWEVDVAQFLYLKNSFLSQDGYDFQILINSDSPGKTFIENQLLLPVGAYSLTRQGRISVGLTKPPIADQRTQVLSVANVINPQNIQVQRGVNNRKFFNEVDWSFDYGDDGNAASLRDTLNSDSLNAIGISSILPIDSQGARTSLGFLDIVEQREAWLFNRYARASVLINLDTTIGVGNQIEVGDIVIVSDNGQLQIPNFATGVRNLGTQLFEVINRNLNLANGVCSLQIEGGTGAQSTDRYATISPSSYIASAATTSEIIIVESFGNISTEQKKWSQYVGLNVRVHDKKFTRVGTTTFFGFDPTDNHGMLLSPPLAFAPSPGDIVDICQYPNDTSALNQALYKLIHCFIDDSVPIVSGVSHYAFYLSASDAGQMQVSFPILVHDVNYINESPETVIASVNGRLITVESDLGFTPNSTMTGELIGFLDGGQPYRLV